MSQGLKQRSLGGALRHALLAALLMALLLAIAAAPLKAAPRSEGLLPAVTVLDLEDRPRALPDPGTAVLVIYEDQDASGQNVRAREVVGRLSDRKENQGRFEVLPVADLAKWNWWPAKKYALADLRKIASKEKTRIFCDWKGAVRKAWGLRRGQSGFILIGTDGRLRFAAEGRLTGAQLEQLVARLAELGVAVD